MRTPLNGCVVATKRFYSQYPFKQNKIKTNKIKERKKERKNEKKKRIVLVYWSPMLINQ